MIGPCKLCRKPAHILYAVDPNKGDVPVCSPCMGRWDPPQLDALLGVVQAAPAPLPGRAAVPFILDQARSIKHPVPARQEGGLLL